MQDTYRCRIRSFLAHVLNISQPLYLPALCRIASCHTEPFHTVKHALICILDNIMHRLHGLRSDLLFVLYRHYALTPRPSLIKPLIHESTRAQDPRVRSDNTSAILHRIRPDACRVCSACLLWYGELINFSGPHPWHQCPGLFQKATLPMAQGLRCLAEAYTTVYCRG